MGRIRVLPDAVANQIAAGEVVERPASVVKELLENSLDAGAGRILVEAESGGRRLLRITDDGHGMLRDDAMLAFERHATSKLSTLKDLDSIATLGFRGEALPSIASVSRLTVETRSPDETTGTKVEIHGGKMIQCAEAALASGTIITVRDLFYNVPARKKFLRSDQTELAHIAALVTHYSLAHPENSFTLRHDSKELLSVTPAASLRERVFQVFGSQTLDDLIDLGGREKILTLAPAHPMAPPEEHEERERIFVLRGFVSKPQVQRYNRNSIYLFVNGRLIRERLLLHALTSAYHNLMPPGAFPFALLFLDCDPQEVDVNVHPSKTEVRFRHGTFVHDFVRDVVREAITMNRPVSEMPRPATAFGQTPHFGDQQPGAQLPYSEFTQRLHNEEPAAGSEFRTEFRTEFRNTGTPAFQPSGSGMEWRIANQPANYQPANSGDPLGVSDADLPSFGLQSQPGPAPRFSFDTATENQPPTSQGFAAHLPDEPGSTRTPLPEAAPSKLRIPDPHGGWPEGIPADVVESLDALRDLRPVGQLHNSFILAAGRDGLWIIDQHVAHERILFEKVLRARASGKVAKQQLLMPLVMDLTAGQQIEFARIAEELEANGFECEPFGIRTIAIKTTPNDVSPGQAERIVRELLDVAEKEFRGADVDEIRRNVAASIACRAAIKINMPLDLKRMTWLLEELARCEYPTNCPHGRPIALRYSMREILKGFHRIS